MSQLQLTLRGGAGRKKWCRLGGPSEVWKVRKSPVRVLRFESSMHRDPRGGCGAVVEGEEGVFSIAGYSGHLFFCYSASFTRPLQFLAREICVRLTPGCRDGFVIEG